jgi:hypothetical protein
MHYVFLQNALTFATDSLLVGSTVYFGVGLGLHLKQKWDELEVPVKTSAPAQLPAATVPVLESSAIPVEAVAIPDGFLEERAELEEVAIDPLDL